MSNRSRSMKLCCCVSSLLIPYLHALPDQKNSIRIFILDKKTNEEHFIVLIHSHCSQHEAGKKAYDAALEKIQETKLKIKEKEAGLVRLTTELATSQSSLKTAKDEEQVNNDTGKYDSNCTILRISFLLFDV